jgi:hypothetical protein
MNLYQSIMPQSSTASINESAPRHSMLRRSFDRRAKPRRSAFVLTLVPSFRRPERALLSSRDKGTALIVSVFVTWLAVW